MFDEALSYLSDALDKPGRAFRGLLGGNPDELGALVPFSDTMGLTDPSRRVSGANLAHDWFGLSPEDASGQAAGFGLEMALDPTNLIGLGAAGKAVKGVRAAEAGVKEAQAAARALNPVREAMLAKGYMPEELFNRSLAHGPDLAGSGEYFHTTGIDTDSLAGLPWRTNNHDELSHIQDSFMRPNDIHYADAKNDLLRMYPTDAEARQSIDQVHSSVFDYRDAVDKPGRMAMVDKFLEKDVPLTEAAKYHIDEATAKGEYPPYLMDMVGDRHRYDMQTLRNAQREGVGTAGHYPGLGTERSYLDVRSPLDVTHLHEVANQTREGTPDLEGFLQWYQGLQNQRLHERASYQPIQDWLGSRGYDSLSRRTASGTQYAVPDKAQIYKPWMAPADATIPADYSGPFAARSAASPLGAAAAHSASVRISQENR